MSEQLRSIFDELHKEYYAMVHHLCMGFMKGDKEQAGDLTQEIFINVWNALPGFRKESSYKTWIYRITVNSCLLQIRKDKNKKQVALQESTQAVTEQREDYQELYSAIGQLAELDRLIIMMVLDEVEYDEISRVMGINPINLRVKIHRIKNRLKKILENG